MHYEHLSDEDIREANKALQAAEELLPIQHRKTEGDASEASFLKGRWQASLYIPVHSPCTTEREVRVTVDGDAGELCSCKGRHRWELKRVHTISPGGGVICNINLHIIWTLGDISHIIQ
jgi:hypothetical protein